MSDDAAIDLFADILGVARAAFLHHHYGKTPFATALDDEVASRLHEAFCEGDVSLILAECRKADNSPYSLEDREGYERDLENHARTINMPYCFCDGARQLNTAVVEALGDLVNDVETGVYISRVGGDVAEWHCDNNHNITLQLAGSKDWHLLAAGTGRADGARGMFDAPRNRAEQLQRAPATGSASTYSLVAGSVLYLPPGDWHRVVPTARLSISVDVRIGHITAARWLSEAVYAVAACQAVPSELAEHGWGCGIDAVGPDATSSLDEHAGVLARHGIGALLRKCPLPRLLPCEDAICDGLHRAASLDYLEYHTRCQHARAVLPASGLVAVNMMVAITIKRRDAEDLVVQMVGASSLTGMEYCRFAIECEAALYAPLKTLVDCGEAPVDALLALLDPTSRSLATKRLKLLLSVLLFGRVLYLPSGGAGGSDGGSVPAAAPPRSKRRR